jgi:hypothetical protein
LQPPLIEPMPVGPGGPVVAALELGRTLDDAAAAAVGVVAVEADVLDWVVRGDAAASVTAGEDDSAGGCEAAEWCNFAG